jgi:uncharacterized protein (TIGR02118 family)
LQRYRINFVTDVKAFGVEEAVVEFDGTAELRFSGEEALKQAFASPIAKEAVGDADNICSRRVEFITDEHVIVRGPQKDTAGMLKLVVLLQKNPELSTGEFRAWWLEHVKLSSQIPGLQGYRINFINEVMGAGFREADVQFDGSAELWFDAVETMNRGFDSEIGEQAVGDAVEHCAKRVRFLTEENIIV